MPGVDPLARENPALNKQYKNGMILAVDWLEEIKKHLESIQIFLFDLQSRIKPLLAT